MADSDKLTLSERPDGFGFYYGWVHRGGQSVRVDVLPPRALWQGDTKSVEPDETSWIVYMNGDEFARVERREDVGGVLTGGTLSLPRPASAGGLLGRALSVLKIR